MHYSYMLLPSTTTLKTSVQTLSSKLMLTGTQFINWPNTNC